MRIYYLRDYVHFVWRLPLSPYILTVAQQSVVFQFHADGGLPQHRPTDRPSRPDHRVLRIFIQTSRRGKGRALAIKQIIKLENHFVSSIKQEEGEAVTFGNFQSTRWKKKRKKSSLHKNEKYIVWKEAAKMSWAERMIKAQQTVYME
jgi:hypothetical protein